MKWLDRLREKTPTLPPRGVTKVTKGAFGAFVTGSGGGHQFFARAMTSPPPSEIADTYPPDELGEPCPDCGSTEKWVWLDERRLCRPCVIQGGPRFRTSGSVSTANN
jgi:hypothetical protein